MAAKKNVLFDDSALMLGQDAGPLFTGEGDKGTADDSILTEDTVQKAVDKIMGELKKQKDKEDEQTAQEEQKQLAAASPTQVQAGGLPGVPIPAAKLPGVPGVFGTQPEDQTLDIRLKKPRLQRIQEGTDWSLYNTAIKRGKTGSLDAAGNLMAQGFRNPVLPGIAQSLQAPQDIVSQGLRERIRTLGQLGSQTDYVNRYLIGRQTEGAA